MAKRHKICLDFDAVLAEYHGWVSAEHTGPPLPGAKKFLERLVKANIDFVVFTTRTKLEVLHNWFAKYNMPKPLEITHEKIRATAYIDDRGVNFDGNFDNLIKTLIKFKPHYKDDETHLKDL